ncbi:MAG: hypothetical protein ABIN96_00165 [Rubrivivax sp.]
MARSTVAAVQRGRSQTRWWAAVATELRWDGQQWYCGASANSDPDVVIEPDVMIDLDGWLLLRLRAPGGGVSRWMPITAAEAGNAWHDLRAALYARAPQVAASVAATRR